MCAGSFVAQIVIHDGFDMISANSGAPAKPINNYTLLQMKIIKKKEAGMLWSDLFHHLARSRNLIHNNRHHLKETKSITPPIHHYEE